LTPNLRIGWHTGEREELRALFALAEDSPLRRDEHLPQGRVLVATEDGEPVGHLQLLRIERDAFTPSEGYPEGIAVDGIPMRDRVWLSLAL